MARFLQKLPKSPSLRLVQKQEGTICIS
jgi:hypothetical protein